MVKEEIVAGIRQAVNKGESLKDAMMSFLNAGYLKEDIEDAARIVQSEGTNYIAPVEQKKEVKEESVEKVTTNEIIPPAPVITQKVSEYKSKEPSSMDKNKKIFLIVLFIFLGLIGISLSVLLIFRDTIMKLISGA